MVEHTPHSPKTVVTVHDTEWLWGHGLVVAVPVTISGTLAFTLSVRLRASIHGCDVDLEIEEIRNADGSVFEHAALYFDTIGDAVTANTRLARSIEASIDDLRTP